jgi:DNA-binding NarL/FixJ family response regulator
LVETALYANGRQALIDGTTYDERMAAGEHPRLLIADDDAIVRSLLSMQVAAEFECVGAAADSDEAIELAEAQRPDVAIVDVSMPGGGGRRATRGIHARSPQTAIVILSNDETHDEVVALMNAGAVVYLRKGIDAPSLIANLFAAIRTHRTLCGDAAAARVSTPSKRRTLFH